jgi:hypothetical protein
MKRSSVVLPVLLVLLAASNLLSANANCTALHWQIFSDSNCTKIDERGTNQWNSWFTPEQVKSMNGCFEPNPAQHSGYFHLECSKQNAIVLHGPVSCGPYSGHAPVQITFEPGKCTDMFTPSAIVTYKYD